MRKSECGMWKNVGGIFGLGNQIHLSDLHPFSAFPIPTSAFLFKVPHRQCAVGLVVHHTVRVMIAAVEVENARLNG